ncbi:MAG TPA: DUF6249 domain-containing protein [Thermomicrobiales bacterium]|jgi:hypothetical protein
MTGVFTAFIIFVLFPGIILGFILLSRYLKYRETLTMIEHGITPPPPPPAMMPPMPTMPMMPQRPPVVVVNRGQGGAGRGTLIWGLVLTGVGLALTLALWPIGFIANSASGNTVNFPLGLGPWMLAGFIPLFVGLALTLAYVIMRPERSPNPPAPFPTGEGGAVGRYSAPMAPGTPSGDRPFMPTEPAMERGAHETIPPGSPTP